MGKGSRAPASCYECAGIVHCLGSPQPGLPREEARARAAACASWHKGRTTEIVAVEGRERGMSRKKAEELVLKGRAQWAGQLLVRVREGGEPPGGAAAAPAPPGGPGPRPPACH